MTSPIRIEIKIGSTRYDVSNYSANDVAELISQINKIQAIVDSYNKKEDRTHDTLDDEDL